MSPKVVETSLAPTVGVATGLVVARLAPAGTAPVLAAIASACVTLLLVAVGDRRLAPVAWFSASAGLGVAFASAPIGYGRGAGTWLLVVGGIGAVLYLLRLRTGNARRLSALPVDPGPVRRMAARVARAVVRVQEWVAVFAPTRTHRLLSSGVAGAVVLGTYGYGVVSGVGWAATAGAVGTPLVATLPFYLITDWRRVDGNTVATESGNRESERGVLDRLEPLQGSVASASKRLPNAVSRLASGRPPGSSLAGGEPASTASAVARRVASVDDTVVGRVGAATRALATVPILLARSLAASAVGGLYPADEHLLGSSESNAGADPATSPDSTRKRDAGRVQRGETTLEGPPDGTRTGPGRERGLPGVAAPDRLTTDGGESAELPAAVDRQEQGARDSAAPDAQSPSSAERDDRLSGTAAIGGLTVSERVAAILEDHTGDSDD